MKSNYFIIVPTLIFFNAIPLYGFDGAPAAAAQAEVMEVDQSDIQALIEPLAKRLPNLLPLLGNFPNIEEYIQFRVTQIIQKEAKSAPEATILFSMTIAHQLCVNASLDILTKMLSNPNAPQNLPPFLSDVVRISQRINLPPQYQEIQIQLQSAYESV